MTARLGVSMFIAAIATSVLVAASPAASTRAATHVKWNESYKYQGKARMSFQVGMLTIGKTSWSARISFRNLTRHTVHIVGDSFGLAFYHSAKLTPTTRPAAFGIANKFSVPRPVQLGPGASWSGVITGPGRPKLTGKAWARVVFGPFTGVPSNLNVFIWITDHSLPLTLGSNASGPGLVI